MIIQELGSCNLHSLCSVTVSPGRLPGGGLPPGSDRIAPDLRDFPLVSSTTLALPIWFTGPFPFHAVSTLPGRHPYISSAVFCLKKKKKKKQAGRQHMITSPTVRTSDR